MGRRRLFPSFRSLRAGVERLSRERVVRRRLPAELGGHRLYVSPDAALKLWRRDIGKADPLLAGLAIELVQPGATVWDVGANVGIFAFAAAYCAGPEGRVLALEADDWLAGLVRRSAAEAGGAYAPVETLAAAVSDQVGLAEFQVAERGRAASHLGGLVGSTQTGGCREIRMVLTVTLDWLLERLPAPDVVKIDVEGAEVQVLRGAEALLHRVRPSIVCEVSAENVEATAKILNRNSYVLFDASAARASRQPLAMPVWNTLALPVEFENADGR
jgi:FkbM family methyltransferase